MSGSSGDGPVGTHDRGHRGFASDNYAGAHPDVVAALAEANGGHVPSYGDDPWTARLTALMRRLFGDQVEVYPVFNGSGANVVSLQSVVPRWGAVICSENAHIHNDENGAPERIASTKLLTVPTPDGKVTPDLIDLQAWGFGDEHRAQPAAVSITEATEVGTVYTPEEIEAVADHAHRMGLAVHMDGARLANAAVRLGVPLRALVTDVGVDVLSLGATKLGGIAAEAVVAIHPEATDSIKYLRKIDMQLGSKMRFLSAQLVALYDDDLWIRLAGRANAMADRLSVGMSQIPGVHLTQATEANGVFAVLPPGVADRLRQSHHFYDWDRASGSIRLMCSWDTTEDDVDGLLAALRSAVATSRA